MHLAETSSAGRGMDQYDNRAGRVILYLLIAYPVIDFMFRNDLGQVGLQFGTVWSELVMALMFILAIVRWRRGMRPPFFSWHRLMGWFLLYTVALFLVSFRDYGQALQGLSMDDYILLLAFLIPFLIGPDDVRPLLHAIAITAILIAIHGWYQYVVKTPIPADWVDAGEHVRTRVFSVIASPNELGAYMALNIPLLLGLGIGEEDKWRKWFYRIGAVLCIGTFLFTFTRGAWMALLVALILMGILVERRFLLVIAVLCVIGFFVPVIHHRIADLTSPVYWEKTQGSLGRLGRWNDGFNALMNGPLFGQGLGTFGGAIALKYNASIYSDNYYLKTLAETGVVGLILFAAMQLALLRDLFRHALAGARGRKRIIMIGGVTGILAMQVHNFVENVFEYQPSIMAFVILASLLLIWSTERSE